jgi:hypothetical protein
MRTLSAITGLAIAVGAPVSATVLEAQDSGILTGVVSTADNRPLGGARISVVGTPLGAVADTDGTFRVATLPLGARSVVIKLIGYATIQMPVQIDSGKTVVVHVTMVEVPVALKTVSVTADPYVLPEIRRFAERRARGGGSFFTREDIDHMQARLFTDILRRVPGMQIETLSGSFGPTYSVQSSRNLGTNGHQSCQMQFYVNGVPFNSVGDLAINHFVSPGEVAAVEVYTGASQIPPEYNSTMGNTRCGLVLIWTSIATAPSRSN